MDALPFPFAVGIFLMRWIAIPLRVGLCLEGLPAVGARPAIDARPACAGYLEGSLWLSPASDNFTAAVVC